MTRIYHVLIGIWLTFGIASASAEDHPRYFAIQVVDKSTGRGVPLVELETVNHIRFLTDSNGWAAIDEPDLMNRDIYFSIRSHGYKYTKDGFGFPGKVHRVKPGAQATIEIQRRNLAERLYRVTGSGIHRDTVLLGKAKTSTGARTPSIDRSLLSGDVFGCDSVMAAIYRGKVHWFWGDTSRPHYPLGGNFHISGATTPLPEEGALQPDVGLELDYFVSKEGAVRPLAQMPGDGPTWISAVTVLKDADHRERMYAGYIKVRNELESYRWGFVVWNDETTQFEQVREFDEKPAMFLEPQTHTFLRNENGTEYVYFANPLPITRVPADPAAFMDPTRYEGFTCLQNETRPEDKQLDRDPSGRLRYSWKTNTPPLTQKDQAMLVAEGIMKPREARIALRDVESGRAVLAHSGSVYWNEYRQRWVLITVELFGKPSMLGEVWYAEANDITGPWTYARKIVTHDAYSFYNPKHHPFFDQDNGRTIYFEGTYTHTFSGNSNPTARYDYNQIMYRLDLSNSELNLPVPFYNSANDSESGSPWVSKGSGLEPTFYALERHGAKTIRLAWTGRALESGLQTESLFHALPADTKPIPPATVPLHEFVHAESGKRAYSTDPNWSQSGFRRNEPPICLVWGTDGAANLSDQGALGPPP